MSDLTGRAQVRQLLTWFAALSVPLLGIARAQAQTLLANPGFEVPTSTTTSMGNWFRFGAGPNGTSEDSAVMPRSGAGHVDLTIIGPNQFAGVFQTLPVPVNPGQTVRFTGWHKSVLAGPYLATSEIKIEWTGAPQNRIDILTLGANYERFSHTAVAPAGTTGATLTYALSTFGAGQGNSRVFIDDFSASFGPFDPIVGDFDDDGDVDVTDYLTLATHLHTDVSALTTAQSYAIGDLTTDLAIDGNDYRAFRFAYDDANGVGSFVAMVAGIPEPSRVLATVGSVAVGLRRRRAAASF